MINISDYENLISNGIIIILEDAWENISFFYIDNEVKVAECKINGIKKEIKYSLAETILEKLNMQDLKLLDENIRVNCLDGYSITILLIKNKTIEKKIVLVNVNESVNKKAFLVYQICLDIFKEKKKSFFQKIFGL